MHRSLVKSILTLLFLSPMQSVSANENKDCFATAMINVPAIENPFFLLPQGTKLLNVTQLRVYHHYHPIERRAYCAKGDYCYPEYIRVGKQNIQSLKLDENCTVPDTPKEKREDLTLYYLIPK